MSAPILQYPPPSGGGTPVGGTGATNTIPRWTGASTLGDSVITQSGTLLGVNKAIPTSTIDVDGLQTNSSGTSASAPTGTLRLNFAGQPTPGYGASIVFSQQWFVGSPTSYVAVGQITGVKTTAGGSYGGGVALWYNNGGTGLVEGMRITDTGNVGIGTAAPQARTHIVAANTAFRGQLSIEATSAVSQITLYTGPTTTTDLAGQLYADVGAVGDVHLSAYKNTASIYFETGTSNTQRWRVTQAGHFLAGADNTYDIGASGATRPRTVYVGTSFDASASGAGLKLPATPGNGDFQTFDCYNESDSTGGTAWSITLNNFGGTPTVVSKFYTRVGRMVFFTINIDASGGNWSATNITSTITWTTGPVVKVGGGAFINDNNVTRYANGVVYTSANGGTLYMPTIASGANNVVISGWFPT